MTLFIYCPFRSRAFYYTETIPRGGGGVLFSNRFMWMHFNRIAFSLELLRMGSHVFGIWGITKFK